MKTTFSIFRAARRCRLIFFLLPGIYLAQPAAAQEPPAKKEFAEITAGGPQHKEGDIYIADKDVDVHYRGMRLQADHVEYNSDTYEAMAKGHVVYDYQNEHMEADEAHLNVDTNKGTFQDVRGTIRLERQPNPLPAGDGKSSVL